MIISYTVPEIWCMTNVIAIFHFGLFFALLPPNSPKNQNEKFFKKWKKTLEISSFYTSAYTSVLKIMTIYYTVPEMWCDTNVIVIFRFVLLFILLPSNTLKNQKLKKKRTKPRRYHHFTQVYLKSWSYAILFLRYGAWQI